MWSTASQPLFPSTPSAAIALELPHVSPELCILSSGGECVFTTPILAPDLLVTWTRIRDWGVAGTSAASRATTATSLATACRTTAPTTTVPATSPALPAIDGAFSGPPSVAFLTAVTIVATAAAAIAATVAAAAAAAAAATACFFHPAQTGNAH